MHTDPERRENDWQRSSHTKDRIDGTLSLIDEFAVIDSGSG